MTRSTESTQCSGATFILSPDMMAGEAFEVRSRFVVREEVVPYAALDEHMLHSGDSENRLIELHTVRISELEARAFCRDKTVPFSA